MNYTVIMMFSIVFALGITACNTTEPPQEKQQSLKQEPVKIQYNDIEMAHLKEKFLSKKAIEFDIVLEFGGSTRLDGKLTMMTNSSKGLIENKDGTTILYSNDTVFHSQEIENSVSARFAAYTWSYFFLLPYKLSDEGAYLSDRDSSQLAGKSYDTYKLTFGENVGDAPEDWYLLYADPQSQLLAYAAYIVTANKSVEKAEEDPHAIQYKNYQMVDGIPIASEWIFWGWQQDEGTKDVLTDQLGSAKLSNFRFISDQKDTFSPRENDKIVTEL